jgi:transcription initiation factor TFIID subunit TAF12
MKIINKLKEVAEFDETVKIKNDRELKSVVAHAKNETNWNKANVGMQALESSSEILKGTTEKLYSQAQEYKVAFKEMTSMQYELVNNAKVLTQKSKDYANQVGEALARIDKVLVKDFESKLLLLERFVKASQEIAELEKNGMLQKITQSFKG